MIPGIVMLLIVLWLAAFLPPTFRDRFEPAIRHPLHTTARQGYCYPRMCRVG
jgi:hypothetical protein